MLFRDSAAEGGSDGGAGVVSLVEDSERSAQIVEPPKIEAKKTRLDLALEALGNEKMTQEFMGEVYEYLKIRQEVDARFNSMRKARKAKLEHKSSIEGAEIKKEDDGLIELEKMAYESEVAWKEGKAAIDELQVNVQGLFKEGSTAQPDEIDGFDGADLFVRKYLDGIDVKQKREFTELLQEKSGIDPKLDVSARIKELAILSQDKKQREEEINAESWHGADVGDGERERLSMSAEEARVAGQAEAERPPAPLIPDVGKIETGAPIERNTESARIIALVVKEYLQRIQAEANHVLAYKAPGEEEIRKRLLWVFPVKKVVLHDQLPLIENLAGIIAQVRGIESFGNMSEVMEKLGLDIGNEERMEKLRGDLEREIFTPDKIPVNPDVLEGAQKAVMKSKEYVAFDVLLTKRIGDENYTADRVETGCAVRVTNVNPGTGEVEPGKVWTFTVYDPKYRADPEGRRVAVGSLNARKDDMPETEFIYKPKTESDGNLVMKKDYRFRVVNILRDFFKNLN